MKREQQQREQQRDRPQEVLYPVKAILEITGGAGVDLALDCAGSTATTEQAIASTAMGGRTVAVANVFEKIALDVRALILKETVIAGSCNHTRDDHRSVISLVAAGKLNLNKSITHRIPFEKMNEGIDMLDMKKGNAIRIVAEQ